MFTNKISKLHINAAKATLLDFLRQDVPVSNWDDSGNNFDQTFTGNPVDVFWKANDSADKLWGTLFTKADTDAKKVALATVLRSMTITRDGVDFAPVSKAIINASIGDLKKGLAFIHVDDDTNSAFKWFGVRI